ncbi:uracil-xanthine permease family protein [Latilactobacillus fuchuensis]|jgi:NCS2 family nucleobase:cation symporter-2|uniref:Permease family protein n=2 Tax=Latilactobacillus fuchuensis TaxID=164393 RepID=A0A2N9DTI9_9LACO|nr:solute carrier family 23 protein [Latilactobacillus fuchuensis]KRL58713.1 permease family protein [Latilactobacillus fuchuensis DSM 14340 = JCM 11249]MCP8858165.1 purine/pyrimidine permease [Latilactobacillus fuchuensis]SPC36918.1 Permease family protein [Latilactobacillus fuchuensis]
MTTHNKQLTIGPDESISNQEAGLLGLQHVLAMDVYVPPVIIAGLLAMSMGAKTGLIQATFLAAGIGTIIQTKYFMKMPVSQGPSFVPIGAIAGVYFASGAANGGMATVLGASVIGALILILLGLTGLFQKIINSLVPQFVGGTIITVVGLSLMPSALGDNIFKASGNVGDNLILAITTIAILVACVSLGIYFPKLQKLFKVSSIIIALLGGTLLATLMGKFDWSSVQSASWFSLPHFTMLHYGIRFSGSAILTFVIIYAVLMTETTGTWFAMSAVTETPISKKQWNHGIIGEGLSCLIAAVLGGSPVTGYATNAGIVSITGVASKKVFISAGIWFIIFGFFNKLAAFLSAIPAPVIGGIFAIICATIMLNGLNVLRTRQQEERDMYIIGIPIIICIAIIIMPQSLVKATPQIVQYLLGSPISICAIAAIVLNLILPKDRNITF